MKSSTSKPHLPYSNPLATSPKRKKNRAKKEQPTAQIAHLVFANAQSQNTKNQKSNFLPTLNRNRSKKCKFTTQ